MFELLSIAGDLASVATAPLLVIPSVLVVWIYRMLTRNPNGWEIKLSVLQGKVVIGFLIAAFVAYAIDIADRFYWIERIKANLPLTEVNDCYRVNVEVPLDGYSYNHCTFQNVTLVINGNGSSKFTYNKLIGAPSFTSKDPHIFNAMRILQSLGVLNVAMIDDSGIKQPGSGLDALPQQPTIIPTSPTKPSQ